jgi:hypothetical protein
MKNSLLFIFICLFAVSSIKAQITITNSAFASVGDVLKTRAAASPGQATNTVAAGTNLTWDYTSLIGNDLDVNTVATASTGIHASLFPSATFIFPDLVYPGDNYVKTSTTEAELLGFSGDPLNIGLVLPVVFNDSKLLLKTPLNYQDTYTDYSDFQLAIKVSDYPALKNLVDSLVPPSTGIVVDSLRITYTDTTENEADAWGTMTLPTSDLPTNSYSVLRLKQSTSSNLVVEFRGTFATIPFAWTDPALPPLNLPLPFAGPASTITYQFLNDNSLEPIAVVQVGDPINNPTVITGITYKSDISTSVFGFAAPSVSVKAYPNPVIDNLNLKFKDFNTGNYDVKVYNIVGRQIMSNNYFISGNETVRIDVSNLPKGTYLYSVVDANGETIITKRIIVARP